MHLKIEYCLSGRMIDGSQNSDSMHIRPQKDVKNDRNVIRDSLIEPY